MGGGEWWYSHLLILDWYLTYSYFYLALWECSCLHLYFPSQCPYQELWFLSYVWWWLLALLQKGSQTHSRSVNIKLNLWAPKSNIFKSNIFQCHGVKSPIYFTAITVAVDWVLWNNTRVIKAHTFIFSSFVRSVANMDFLLPTISEKSSSPISSWSTKLRRKHTEIKNNQRKTSCRLHKPGTLEEMQTWILLIDWYTFHLLFTVIVCYDITTVSHCW